MIRHVVLIRWVEDCSEERIRLVESALTAVAAQVPQVRRYQLGRDLGVRPGNANFVIQADFEDVEGYLAYAADPEHLRVIEEELNPWVRERSAAQVTLDS